LGLVGREVLVPAYHHGVEISALLDAGARLRFVRIDGSMRLDLDDVEAKVGPSTRALYVIHYLGFPQPMAALSELARRHSLLLIEDCALATFSSDGERPLGSTGDAAIFCFYKTVPVPHGGALLIRGQGRDRSRNLALSAPPLRPTLSQTAGSLLLTGELRLGTVGAAVRSWVRGATREARSRAWEEHVPVGTQAFDRNVVRLGMSPVSEYVLRRADAREIVRRRRANWRELHQRLGDAHPAIWNDLPVGVCPLFYPVRVKDKDRALAHLRGNGIEAVDFWRFHHDAVDARGFPEVDRLRREVVELPCHQDLGAGELERIARVARDAIRA
jgi:dTDP-4-amino-4,6-dideoxygalactose transaminase